MTRYELHLAVEKGDRHRISELLSASRSDIDINERDDKGLPPLVYAAEDDLTLLHTFLQHGANANDVNFTPLLEAVAFGSQADIEAAIERGFNLEERDYWGRTAWLLAIQIGDISKAKLLLEHGVEKNAQGRDGESFLFYAIKYNHAPMLRWLLEIGAPIQQTDNFDRTPLIAAVQSGNEECVEVLLKAGIDVNQKHGYESALSNTNTRKIAIQLMKAGADPLDLTYETRRDILGFPLDPDEKLFAISKEDFFKDRSPRFGTQNPEKMHSPFWEAMIRSGINAWQAGHRFGLREIGRPPTWCAQRFGQSITFLPDGRIIQVAGEHEDWYDPDFCIYNDVFVHNLDGTIDIYSYPEAVFPPTDFHTATLIGGSIYLIGSLGYAGKRHYEETPVYRLDTSTFHIEHLETTGDQPGLISSHQAMQSGPHEIRITTGDIWKMASDGEEKPIKNTTTFILDIEQRIWRV